MIGMPAPPADGRQFFELTEYAVAHLRGLGFTVFPCAQDKRPKVRWQDDEPAGGWRFAADDLIGVRLPAGTVVLDIDDIDRFRSTGRDVVMSAFSPTRRDGGLHIYYRHDPQRSVEQVTAGQTNGYDTRVGGKGYVIAWYPEDWRPVSEWAMAPAWLYDGDRGDRSDRPAEGDGQPMGTRLEILSYLGRLALKGGLTEDDYFALLGGKLERGEIVSLDPGRPWTAGDLRKLASEAARWEPAAPVGRLLLAGQRAAPEELAGLNAADLLDMALPPLEWRVPGLMPEGLGLIAAPPKTGKSVFAYQLAVELAFGGSLLGVAVPQPTRVLYYALEDGRRRSQQRINGMLRGRRQGIERLDLRWSSPRLGGELESEVHDWLSANPHALVIIDVLAKVRPKASMRQSSLNAYDVDYDALSGIHKVTKAHPGSTILIVTHDRKAGSDDWMSRVTGTRGVTGVADFVIYINRQRGKELGSIFVSGRDVEDHEFDVQFDVTGWRTADPLMLIAETSPTRQTIYNWLRENGPGWPIDVAKATGLAHDVVRARMRDMASDGQIAKGEFGKGYQVTDD